MHLHDLPELDELDNLHSPQGPLKKALELAASLFGAKRTWFLVNGSTSGILIALLSCIRLHQQHHSTAQRSIVLLPRDAHKSAFDALTVSQNCDAVLLPCTAEPDFGVTLGFTLDTVQRAIDLYGDQVSAADCCLTAIMLLL